MAATPRYREIADELRDAILGESSLLGVKLRGEAKLPTEPELGEHFSVSRGTIREAIKSLTLEGLIEARGRQGTFVRRLGMLTYSTQYEHPDRQGDADSWSDQVVAGDRVPSQDFDFRIVPATNGVAQRLQIEVGSLVAVRECLRIIDGTPWQLQTSFYPLDVASAAGLDTPRDIEEGTVRRLAAHGYREIGWIDEITCRPANEDDSRMFGLSIDASIMVYHRVAWTDQRPIRLTRELLPADRNILSYRHGDLSAKQAGDNADPR